MVSGQHTDVIVTYCVVLLPVASFDISRELRMDFTFSFFKIYLFIYLFMAALGLLCCTQAFSSCGERGLLFVAVHGLLIAVASLVVAHGL